MMKNVNIVVFLSLLAILLLTVEPGQAFDCDEAKISMLPCVEYVTSDGGDPSAACCSAVKDLKASTPTRDDRRAACECLKEAASHFPGIREDLAASLPKRCGVEIGFTTIGKNIKCSDIP